MAEKGAEGNIGGREVSNYLTETKFSLVKVTGHLLSWHLDLLPADLGLSSLRAKPHDT